MSDGDGGGDEVRVVPVRHLCQRRIDQGLVSVADRHSVVAEGGYDAGPVSEAQRWIVGRESAAFRPCLVVALPEFGEDGKAVVVPLLRASFGCSAQR